MPSGEGGGSGADVSELQTKLATLEAHAEIPWFLQEFGVKGVDYEWLYCLPQTTTGVKLPFNRTTTPKLYEDLDNDIATNGVDGGSDTYWDQWAIGDVYRLYILKDCQDSWKSNVGMGGFVPIVDNPAQSIGTNPCQTASNVQGWMFYGDDAFPDLTGGTTAPCNVVLLKRIPTSKALYDTTITNVRNYSLTIE